MDLWIYGSMVIIFKIMYQYYIFADKYIKLILKQL